MTKIEIVSEKEQQKGVMSGFLALPYISRMLWHVRNSRGRPINAPAAFIHPCQPIVAQPPSERTSDIIMVNRMRKGALMKLKLSVVSLLVVALPICAQAQVPQTPQTPKAPKASKELKGAKGSKELSKVAAAQKVVKTISGDKAKTQTYCDIGKLGDQIEEAGKQNDMKKIDELNSKMQELATKLGPDYVELMGGLEDIDPTSKESQDVGVALASLDKLCAK
jgi:hypothetical protein